MRACKGFYRIFSVLFLVIFIPILFCIVIWGNDMEYNVVNKVVTLQDNKVLLLLCIPVLILIFLFVYLTRKIEMTKKLSVIMNIVMLSIFTIIFLVNMEVCKCINIAQGWDVSCVVGTAYNLHNGILIGDDIYYSLCPNNVPITFVLYKLFDLADAMEGFTYVSDFMWVVAVCIMLSVTGYLTCVTVKKITQNFAATCITCFLYVGCVCFTPWKTVPYTDMFAIMFPMICISFYVFHYYSEKRILRYVLWFFIFLSGSLGALIKPTVFIVPIAIVLCEILRCVVSFRDKWKQLIVKVVLVITAIFIYMGCKAYIYEDVGYKQNEEIQFTAVHYMMMGLNEESTGSYHSGDVAISGSVSLLKDRTEKQIQVIKERLEEKGFFGYLNFLLRKMVMTFNDGTFGWGREGGYIPDVYPIYTDASYVTMIRDIFMPNYRYSGYFNTYSQAIWLLIIFCIPGVCFMEKEKREVSMPILVSMLGIIFYLMLFEARARYLICFLPILIFISSVGITSYYNVFYKYLISRRKRKNETI